MTSERQAEVRLGETAHCALRWRRLTIGSIPPARVVCRFAPPCPYPWTSGRALGVRRYARRPVEGPLLAASRTASAPSLSHNRTASGRISFAKIREPLEVPTSSLSRRRASTGSSATPSGRPRVAAAVETGRQDVPDHLRSGGDLRGDLPDRGLLGIHVALVPGPPLRAAQVLDRRVQGAGHDLRGPALRDGRVHEHHHRRDQEPDGLHGRLPAHDRARHLRHQRHRARRRLPARPLAGRVLRAHRRQDVRQGRLHRQDHPLAGRLARVRDRQARHGRCPHRPQAQAVGHGAAQGPRLDRGADPRGVRRRRVDARHAREGPHRRQDEALLDIYRKLRPGEPPTRSRPRRRCSTTSTSTPSATTSRRSAATRSTRSWGWSSRCRPAR